MKKKIILTFIGLNVFAPPKENTSEDTPKDKNIEHDWKFVIEDDNNTQQEKINLAILSYRRVGRKFCQKLNQAKDFSNLAARTKENTKILINQNNQHIFLWFDFFYEEDQINDFEWYNNNSTKPIFSSDENNVKQQILNKYIQLQQKISDIQEAATAFPNQNTTQEIQNPETALIYRDRLWQVNLDQTNITKYKNILNLNSIKAISKNLSEMENNQDKNTILKQFFQQFLLKLNNENITNIREIFNENSEFELHKILTNPHPTLKLLMDISENSLLKANLLFFQYFLEYLDVNSLKHHIVFDVKLMIKCLFSDELYEKYFKYKKFAFYPANDLEKRIFLTIYETLKKNLDPENKLRIIAKKELQAFEVPNFSFTLQSDTLQSDKFEPKEINQKNFSYICGNSYQFRLIKLLASQFFKDTTDIEKKTEIITDLLEHAQQHESNNLKCESELENTRELKTILQECLDEINKHIRQQTNTQIKENNFLITILQKLKNLMPYSIIAESLKNFPNIINFLNTLQAEVLKSKSMGKWKNILIKDKLSLFFKNLETSEETNFSFKFQIFDLLLSFKIYGSKSCYEYLDLLFPKTIKIMLEEQETRSEENQSSTTKNQDDESKQSDKRKKLYRLENLENEQYKIENKIDHDPYISVADYDYHIINIDNTEMRNRYERLDNETKALCKQFSEENETEEENKILQQFFCKFYLIIEGPNNYKRFENEYKYYDFDNALRRPNKFIQLLRKLSPTRASGANLLFFKYYLLKIEALKESESFTNLHIKNMIHYLFPELSEKYSEYAEYRQFITYPANELEEKIFVSAYEIPLNTVFSVDPFCEDEINETRFDTDTEFEFDFQRKKINSQNFSQVFENSYRTNLVKLFINQCLKNNNELQEKQRIIIVTLLHGEYKNNEQNRSIQSEDDDQQHRGIQSEDHNEQQRGIQSEDNSYKNENAFFAFFKNIGSKIKSGFKFIGQKILQFFSWIKNLF